MEVTAAYIGWPRIFFIDRLYYTADNDIFVIFGKIISHISKTKSKVLFAIYSLKKSEVITEKEYVIDILQSKSSNSEVQDLLYPYNVNKKIKQIDLDRIKVANGLHAFSENEYNVTVLTTEGSFNCLLPISSGIKVIDKYNNIIFYKCIIFISDEPVIIHNDKWCDIMDGENKGVVYAFTPIIQNIYKLDDGTYLLTFQQIPYILRVNSNFETKINNGRWHIDDMQKALQVQSEALNLIHNDYASKQTNIKNMHTLRELSSFLTKHYRQINHK